MDEKDKKRKMTTGVKDRGMSELVWTGASKMLRIGQKDVHWGRRVSDVR